MSVALTALVVILVGSSDASAQLLKEEHPAAELGTDVIEKRGDEIPLDLPFRNSRGEDVTLRDYFDGDKPVALVLGYYDCPLLCTRVFNGAQDGFKGLSFTLGKDYRAITVSIDHTNSSSQAAGKKAAMLAGLERTEGEDSWVFLTGDAPQIKRLADSVGYQYRYLPKSGEFSHPAVMVILSPNGVVSNYIYGVDFPAKQLRLALLDAAEGKIGGFFDKVLLFCHVYDPSSGAFTVQAFRVMQVVGTITAVLVVGGVAGLFAAERVWRRPGRRDAADGALPEGANQRVSETDRRWRGPAEEKEHSGAHG